jgi:hypothetical protein
MTTLQVFDAFLGIVLVVLFVHNEWNPERKAVAG